MSLWTKAWDKSEWWQVFSGSKGDAAELQLNMTNASVKMSEWLQYKYNVYHWGGT